MKDLNERILELINEEDDGPSFGGEDSSSDSESSSSEDTSSDDSSDNGDSSSEISSEPSTIFGSNDTKNHNKYKVTITNEEGSVWFYFWDSLYNTENKKKPSQDDVLACFGIDVGSVMDGISKEEFIEISGYDKTEDATAQKAYEGCQKMLERAKKLFKDNQIKELLRLSQEY